MIIDAHAHLLVMPALMSHRVILQLANGQHGYDTTGVVPDADLQKAATQNVRIMDEVGTDMQLLSPRPFMLMHSESNSATVKAWVRLNNDCIARTVGLFPDRFRGVAGLPQAVGEPVEFCFDEIDRCINELKFVGVMVNPDPSEGKGLVPPLGHRYWDPLWRKLADEDIPAHIHSAGCCGRETYDEHFSSEESLAITSVAREGVFERFPKLKLMISHGGGAVPYQVGRWRSNRLMRIAAAKQRGETPPETFEETLRRFHYDTCLHHKPSLELLFDLIGADRCLFGTERPGSGSAINPDTGRPFDDLKPVIESIERLSQADRRAIFADNARRFFSRLNP